MSSKVQVSVEIVCPFLKDKWYWRILLDDYMYACSISPSYSDALREIDETLKRLYEESNKRIFKQLGGDGDD